MIGKRGVSAVVATVLLLIITIASIAIIAGVIIPFVRNSLDKGTECVGFEDYFSFEESFGNLKYNCYDDVDGLQGASVRSAEREDLEENIAGFELVFVRSGSSDKVSIRKDVTTTDVKMLDGNTNLEVPEAGEIRTYLYTTSETFDKIEVAPVLTSGRICAVSDSINNIVCDSAAKTEIN